MNKVLGLDLGTNSIGWALVNADDSKIIDMGVRVFPEGVGRNKGKEISKNATRTEKRQVRRQTFRRKMRKHLVAKALMQKGMFPLIDLSSMKGNDLQQEPLPPLLASFFAINPYEARTKAARGEKLSLPELGRIFYNLAQRRGYKNLRNGEDDNEGVLFEGKPKEDKKGILSTQEGIEKQAEKTLGAYLASLNPHKERIRNRYTRRQMYIKEFEKIWEQQQPHYPEVLTEAFKKELGDANSGLLFYQRPLRSQKHLVGKCTFEPTKTKCPSSAIHNELFRLHQFINSIRYGIKQEPLTPEQREKALEFCLAKTKAPKFGDLLKKLKLDKRFANYTEDSQLPQCRTWATFQKVFGKKAWTAMSLGQQEKYWHLVYSAQDNEWLKEYTKTHWGLEDKAWEVLKKFRPEEGYASLSSKAIKHILPYLQKGLPYHEAVVLGGVRNAFGQQWSKLSTEDQHAIEDTTSSILDSHAPGKLIEEIRKMLQESYQLAEKQLQKLYHHSQATKNLEGKAAKLSPPENLRNPIVQQVLHDMRKVVNALIDEYGAIDTIKVEMARDLKKSKKGREEIEKRQRQLEQKNVEAKALLDELGKPHTATNITKVKLWEESKHQSPYTGNKISKEQLFDGSIEIEHIIPYSRSLDNSFMNKTLCERGINQRKGNKTPYELYGHSEETWREVREKAFRIIPKKAKRFTAKEHPELDQFISRQLNDSRYISKQAKTYLTEVCEDVQVTQGTVTAILRKQWGLESLVNPPIQVGNLKEGEYLVAIDGDRQIQDIRPWDENVVKVKKELAKKGQVLQGHVKEYRFYPKKDRSQHSHHALDALVVALTERRFLQHLATMNAKVAKTVRMMPPISVC